MGNPSVRDRREASGNVTHGGTRLPRRNRKRGDGHSPPNGVARPDSIPTPETTLKVEGWPTTLAFSRDGRWLGAAGIDESIQLWAQGDELATIACALSWRNLAEGEWEDLVDRVAPYERTCAELPLGEGASPQLTQRSGPIRDFIDHLVRGCTWGYRC